MTQFEAQQTSYKAFIFLCVFGAYVSIFCLFFLSNNLPFTKRHRDVVRNI